MQRLLGSNPFLENTPRGRAKNYPVGFLTCCPAHNNAAGEQLERPPARTGRGVPAQPAEETLLGPPPRRQLPAPSNQGAPLKRRRAPPDGLDNAANDFLNDSPRRPRTRRHVTRRKKNYKTSLSYPRLRPGGDSPIGLGCHVIASSGDSSAFPFQTAETGTVGGSAVSLAFFLLAVRHGALGKGFWAFEGRGSAPLMA